MTELIFVACTVLQGAGCKIVSLTYDTDGAPVTVYECAMYGQIALSQWAEYHPAWYITKWKCVEAGQVAKI